MKKMRYLISLILLLLVVLFRFIFSDLYFKIKDQFLHDFSLYNMSFIYSNYYDDSVNQTSSNEEILVENYIINEKSITVFTLNDKVFLPFSGIITKKKNNYVEIEVSFDVKYYIYDITPSVILYERVKKNETIGKSDSYVIWSNSEENLKLLNYKISTDEA